MGPISTQIQAAILRSGQAHNDIWCPDMGRKRQRRKHSRIKDQTSHDDPEQMP
ncbi:hypothetical protein BU24DRAFT_425360, partial [Aaosphaeria arxii CBS 175.79]